MDRDVQVEPVGLAGEAVERDLVPARGEPVEVLEDVAVAAADAGVLGHVDDAQAAVGGAHLARVEELAPARPEVALGLALALAEVGAARDRLAVHEHGGGGEGDAVPGLPAAQAVVDVLVGHRVALVELADLIDQRPAQVHARAGHREHRLGDRRGAEVRRLEAEAVIEPLAGTEVAHGAGELDLAVGVEQLGADDADVVRLAGAVLERRKPVAARDHVGVQDDDVELVAGGAQAAVEVGGEAGVLLALDDLDPLDRAQRAPGARGRWRRRRR